MYSLKCTEFPRTRSTPQGLKRRGFHVIEARRPRSSGPGSGLRDAWSARCFPSAQRRRGALAPERNVLVRSNPECGWVVGEGAGGEQNRNARLLFPCFNSVLLSFPFLKRARRALLIKSDRKAR